MKSSLPSLRTLLADDEPPALDALRGALEPLPGLEVVMTCRDGTAALAAIRELAPDLVFLDVRMPGLDGVEVVRRLDPDSRPAVVFVTAFEDRAVQAFELGAVDYVVKPFDDERVRQAALRAVSRRELTRVLRGGEATPATQPAGKGPEVRWAERLMVRDGDAIRFVRTDQVERLEAAGNYVEVVVGEDHFRVRSTLREMAERLDPRRFVQVHRSHVVNLDRIEAVHPWFGGDYMIVMADGTRVRVSRTHRENLLRASF